MSNSILNMYPVFENNQVLTSQQLNELSTYLDQQTRLTRRCLIGIGTVCGLKQNYDTVVNKLTISQGTGITSEGHLITTGDCEFTQYRSYVLPPSLVYPPFINPSTNQQVVLWELLRSDYMPLPTETVAPLDFNFVNGLTPGDKKIVMLFLEMVDVPNDSCLGKSCDTAGAERTFTLRKLLVSVNDLKIILKNTGEFDLTFVGKFDLPDLLSQRPLFDPLLSNSKDYFAFSQDFTGAAASVYKRNPSDPKDILPVLRQCYTVFQPILKDIYNNTNPFLDSQIPNLNIWNQIMNGDNDTVTGPSYWGVQYFYDFMRDLILAYNEFRDAAFELLSDCCFDTRLFPMHLVLGEAIPIDPDKPSIYRDDFVGIPLTPEQRSAKDTVICYFNRMVLMVRMFDVTRIHQHNLQALPPTFITPSFEKFGKLSQRSIPYYYKIDDIDPQLGKLEKFWNYQNIARNKDVNGQYPVVAYGNQSNNQTAPIDPIQTPLFYDLDQFNFLRIEGHLGKDKDAVIADLNTKKNSFDLPFNVVAVRLQGTSNPDDILARCNFNDLRSQYVAYRNELSCFIQRLFDNFFEPGPKSDGTFVVKKAPIFVRNVLNDTQSPTRQGNSSASYMPAYFAVPGQSLPRFIPPIRYAPVPTTQVTNLLGSTYLPALMDRLIQLQLLLTPALDDFDYGYDTIANTNNSFIGSYIDAVSLCNIAKALIGEFADQVTRSSKTRFTPEMYFVFSQWINEQLYFLNEFITDCKFRKVEAVFYELQFRIGYLQSKDPTVFSNFITRNPGIDHKAGTPMGGTIVLVYPGQDLHFSTKIKKQFTAQIEMIQALKVRKGVLQAVQGRTPAQNNELAAVDSQLCDLYAVQVEHPRPLTFDIGTPAIAIQEVSIGANEVIADFALPYLTNCECECSDIPAPTTAELAIPAIAMPAFYEYFLGDYAFANDITTFTFGCKTPAQATIDVRPNINYDTISTQDGILKLKFVANGDVLNPPVDVLTRSNTTSITTAHGGTVTILTTAHYDIFRYTPPVNFLGVDSFKYVFEIYNSTSNVLLHSNQAEVTVVVTTRCTPPTVTNTATADGVLAELTR